MFRLLIVVLIVVALGVWGYRLVCARNQFASPLERATFSTLHTVSLAAPALREGLSS